MTAYEISKVELTAACSRLAKAIKDTENRADKEVALTHKGKTLYHINRERAKTTKMTVNY